MKTAVTLVTLLAGMIAYQQFQIFTLQHHRQERLRDDFVVSLLSAIRDGDTAYLEEVGLNAKLANERWQEILSHRYVIHRDTYGSTVEHVVVFENGVGLSIETAEMEHDHGFLAKFRILVFGIAGGEYPTHPN